MCVAGVGDEKLGQTAPRGEGRGGGLGWGQPRGGGVVFTRPGWQLPGSALPLAKEVEACAGATDARMGGATEARVAGCMPRARAGCGGEGWAQGRVGMRRVWRASAASPGGRSSRGRCRRQRARVAAAPGRRAHEAVRVCCCSQVLNPRRGACVRGLLTCSTHGDLLSRWRLIEFLALAGAVAVRRDGAGTFEGHREAQVGPPQMAGRRECGWEGLGGGGWGSPRATVAAGRGWWGARGAAATAGGGALDCLVHAGVRSRVRDAARCGARGGVRRGRAWRGSRGEPVSTAWGRRGLGPRPGPAVAVASAREAALCSHQWRLGAAGRGRPPVVGQPQRSLSAASMPRRAEAVLCEECGHPERAGGGTTTKSSAAALHPLNRARRSGSAGVY
jgi:hypothetical protein